jgi:choline dehydrogenase
MLSGVGPAAHLREHGIDVVLDLPGVGQHLQDHLATGVIVFARQPVTLVAAESLANLLRFLLLRRGMLTSNLGEACAFVRSRPDLEAPDLELIFAPVPFIEHGLVKPPGHGITIGTVLLQPKSVGSIALRSANPLDPPLIDPRYLSDAGGEDLRLLIAGSRLAHRVMRSPALAAFAGDRCCPTARSGATPTSSGSSVSTPRASTTRWAPAAWAATRRPWSTHNSACAASRRSASLTPRSCPRSSAVTPTRRRP